MKILGSLNARNDQGARLSYAAGYLDSSETTSRLLVPISTTPLLDYLEESVEGRTKYLAKLLSTYRNLTSKPKSTIAGSPKATQDGDIMTKVLKAKYLRTGSKTPAMKDKKKAAITMAVERLEKALALGKHEAALLLADLYLVSASIRYIYLDLLLKCTPPIVGSI